MIKTNSIRYLFSFVLALWASALSAQAHWSVTPQDFQYTMSMYYTIQDDGVDVDDISNYEVATFVDEECRGVGTIVTQGANTAYQIMVYSNESEGEKLVFKAYDKTTMEEKILYGSTVTFVSQGIVGMPSSPFVLDFVQQYIMGDADGDGEITINDVTMTVSVALGHPATNFNRDAADVDGDGEITINDVTTIVRMALGKA